jgi:hypothetical protein
MIKIVSGGQTGADRAALDAASDAGVPCGGWCPAGRSAEDGVIPQRYPLTPLTKGGYAERTRQNVQDSDGTVIIAFGHPLKGGTETTRLAALELGRPILIVDASSEKEASAKIAQFVRSHDIHILNVAGPRASEEPAIGAYVYDAIRGALNELIGKPER